MKSNKATSVTLYGKGSWGITLAGGKDLNLPIVISKVKPGSIASHSNVQPGDVIVAINGENVKEMTLQRCDELLAKAKVSLFIMLIKNGATVIVEPTGRVRVDGDRDIYKDESSDLQRLSQYNRSAKPYFVSSDPLTPTIPQINNWAQPQKPVGFRSVKFNPGLSTKSGIIGKENVANER